MLSVSTYAQKGRASALSFAGILRAQAGCRKGMELLCRPDVLVQMHSIKQCPGMMPELRISWCKVTKKSERLSGGYKLE